MKKINGYAELAAAVKACDYEKCSSMEIIKVFAEDMAQITAEGAEVEYHEFLGSFEDILPCVQSLPKADKMIIYTLQDPAEFDEDELDRMCKCFDTLTGMRTAYGLKMTDKFPPQFHIFIRKKGV